MGKGGSQGEEADSVNGIQFWPQKLYWQEPSLDGDQSNGDKADDEVWEGSWAWLQRQGHRHAFFAAYQKPSGWPVADEMIPLMLPQGTLSI